MAELPWGSHFCQFYQTEEDLLDILIPYFRAGLENNELCLWVVSPPVSTERALEALNKAVPRFGRYAKNGQMEVIPRRRWQATNGKPASAIVSTLDKAIANGFDGLRLASHALPSRNGGKSFTCSGADTVGKYNAIAAFAYPRDKFDAIGLMEVVKNHRFALVRNAGRWEVIESSEARIVKDALKRSEEKLRSLFSNMSEGFAYHRIVLDARGKPCDYIFLEVNEAFEKLTGLRGKDIVGKRVTEVLPGIEKDPIDWIKKYGKVALTGKPVQFESYSKPINKWYSVSAFSPHKGYFAVTFNDISERKEAEEQIRALNKRLQQNVDELTAANKELETFSYSISHDLRAPLRHIAGFAELLKARIGVGLDKKSEHYFAAISSSAYQMGQLIDDLLAFSRTGRVDMEVTRVPCHALLQETVRAAKSETNGREVVWNIQRLPEVWGDPTYLRLVFTNLISNALKYTRTRERAVITIGSEEQGHEYVFSVRDNGVGFDMKYGNKLFGLFQRLHRADEFEGNGVGLANVQRIVHRHGGRVWAEASLEKGATFFFSLPKERRSVAE